MVVTAGVTTSDVELTAGEFVTFVNCSDEAPLTCHVSVEVWPAETAVGVATKLEMTGKDGGELEV